MSSTILRKGNQLLDPDLDAVIGTLYPYNPRFMLVGFQLHPKDMSLVPVWKDRKECIKEAKRRY